MHDVTSAGAGSRHTRGLGATRRAPRRPADGCATSSSSPDEYSLLVDCPGASPPLGKGTTSWVSRKVGKASSRCFHVSLSYSAFRFNQSSRASLLTSLPYDSCLFAQCICHTMGNGTPGDVRYKLGQPLRRVQPIASGYRLCSFNTSLSEGIR